MAVHLQDWTAIEAAALDGLLTAAATLLDRLRATRDPAERAALGAAFDARVAGLRAELVHRHGLDERAADAALARAVARLTDLVRGARLDA